VFRYAAPLFLGAFLLFQVQPMVARSILPWFGGTPSVWTTCMLFFQILLVLGYAYSHWVATALQPKAQTAIHWALLGASLALLAGVGLVSGAPVVPDPSWKPVGSSLPVLHIIGILAATVGLPYLVLATTSPLMQAWFARSAPGVSPYRLYSLSNAGSLLGLLSYPFLIEPAMAQREQALLWSGLYLVFIVGCGTCAWRAKEVALPAEQAAAAEEEGDEKPGPVDRLLWVALPALAVVLLLAVTNHLCQDVAVTPFLWVLPLTLYLLSFIICFDHERWYYRPAFVGLALAAIMASIALLPHPRSFSVPWRYTEVDFTMPWQIGLYSVALFLCCMVCHGELVSLKPKPRHLTGFYLSVATGGAIGGILVGIVAPLVFSTYLELPLGLVLCGAVAAFMPGFKTLPYRYVLAYLQLIVLGLVIGIAALPLIERTPEKGVRTLAVSRNFYGMLKVEQRNAGTKDEINVLLHGRIIHGFQVTAPKDRRLATSYYGPKSGVSYAIHNHPRRLASDPAQRSLRIGVAGLGVGTACAFANKGDTVRFYEINPVVIRLARDSGLFTYIHDCPGQVDIVLGDARISMERELHRGEPQQFDLLLLDAFNGDAVPAHLLTREALTMYLNHLRMPNGALIVDVSNAVLDLPPVIWKVANSLGLDACLVRSPRDEGWSYLAYWMILTPNRNYLRDVKIDGVSWEDTSTRKVRMWTDDYYNLFQIMK
jgi:spermidine synthase